MAKRQPPAPAAGPMLPAAVCRSRADSTPPSGSQCELIGRDYERALAFVARVPVFQCLPPEDLPLLVQAMAQEEFTPGQLVIQQGEVNDRLFIILSGQAEVFRSDGSGDEAVLVALVSGDYFGEQELLRAEAARASVRATGTGNWALVTLSVSHSSFWRLGIHQGLCIPRRRAVVDLRAARERMAEREQQPGTTAERPATDAERDFIAEALRANANLAALCPLGAELLAELVAAAHLRTFAAGEVVMRQGDLHLGSLHIVQRGNFEIFGQGRRGTLRQLAGQWESCVRPGGSFGELELLYSAPSAATVTALEDSEAWVISHGKFTEILHQALESRLEGYVEVLKSIKLFSGLYNAELRALAQALTEVSYQCGEDIITQGELSTTFYLLMDGEVAVLLDAKEVERRTASRARKTADFFGDTEILNPGPRLATVRVQSESATVLALDKATFELILKPLNELLEDIQRSGDERSPLNTTGDLQRIVEDSGLRRWNTYMGELSPGAQLYQRADLRLLGCLGAGGFGSVDLAEHAPTGRHFALKRLRRCALADPWSRRQALAEKSILSMTCCPFVVRLHTTFRTEEALCLLLEFVPGGDLLHAFLHHELFGNEGCARFYAAGAALALGHLHERRILHRDVKPENILLDGQGWPKLTDFGLAKFCVGNTFTLCGTPNYLAPETLLQAGHCDGVDWWALGVLSYEMMAGRTPFEDSDADDAKMCAAIKRGIPSPSAWSWPAQFGPSLQSFVCALLRPRVSERLPMLPGGLANLQEHPWFQDLDWPKYEARQLQPPCPGRAPGTSEAAPSLSLPSSKDLGWSATEVCPCGDGGWDAEF